MQQDPECPATGERRTCEPPTPARFRNGPGADAPIVLVTGASKGIGAATARALGEAGMFVVAHYGTDETGAARSTADIPPERKLLLHADFADPAAADLLWAQALSWRGRIDVFVNNAAVMTLTPLSCSDEQWIHDWTQTFQVNVSTSADLTRRAVSQFLAQNSGVLITLSSVVAQRGPNDPALIPYTASKAAVRTLTQAVAGHYGRRGILAYVLAPGAVATAMTDLATSQIGGERKLVEHLALKAVPAHELAHLIVALASRRLPHLSGATLDVNDASYVR